MNRPGCGRRLAVAWCLTIALGLGCRRVAHSPEEAFGRLQQAVAAQDPAALFDALDQRSRWAFMTVQKSHREAYDIILSNYPEGPERERELRRFQRGAILGSARELFAEEIGQRVLAGFSNPLPAATRFEVVSVPVARSAGGGDGQGSAEAGDDETQTMAVLPDGKRIPFRRGPDGGWGLATVADEAAERQNHALHDVDLVRVNAADYERAATRAAH
jgi:hypothetical protein